MATKMPGYTGQYLEIDLTNKTFKAVPQDPAIYREWIGGRALAVKMLLDAYGPKWKDINPLGPEALFIINTGPLNGLLAGKLNVSFKSPANGAAIGSSVSIDMNADLKFAGWDGVVFKGKSPNPVSILINDDKVIFDDATPIWGKSREEGWQWLHEKYGFNTTPLMISAAGENLVKFAVAQSGLFRAAGRGGSGAVMGSKNLKAVTVKHSGAFPDVADPKGVDTMMEWIRINTPFTRFSFREYGTTSIVYTSGAVNSAEPIKNWQTEWHNNVELRGEMYAANIWTRRYWADYACSVACSKLGQVRDPASPYRGVMSELPDYESGALLGTNLDIWKLDQQAVSTDFADTWGMDIIGLGNVLSMAAELFERGIITTADIGFELKWGDVEAFRKLSEMIAKRQGFGAILAEGQYAAARKIGKGAEKYDTSTKAIEQGAHGQRSTKDKNPISYPCSTQGGDHTSNPSNSKSPEAAIWGDSLVQCSFLGITQAQQVQFINSVTGANPPYTTDELNTRLLLKWVTAQWMTVRMAGWLKDTDVNVPRFYEPLPEGPFKGAKIDPAQEETMKQEYYKTMGWDANGIPTADTLKKHGLDAFEAVMAPLRAK